MSAPPLHSGNGPNPEDARKLMDLPPAGQQAGVERMASAVKQLNEDIREWVELKIQLLKMELTETAVQKVGSIVILALLGLFSLTFVLITAAVGIGMLLNNLFFGFLIVTGVLVLLLLIMALAKPTLYRATVKKEFKPPTAAAGNKAAEA